MATVNDASIPVVTKSDVASIRRYVTKGKSLPTDLNSITQILGVTTTGIPGLEPNDIRALYSDININAIAWNNVEVSMKKVAASLSTFADDLQTYGGALVDTIKTMPGYIDFSGQVKDISEEAIQALPAVYMTQADGQRVSTIQEYLQYLKESIEAKRSNTRGVINIITSFRTAVETIMPGVGAMLKLTSKDELNSQVTSLQAKIDDMELRIEQKKAEYGFVVWDVLASFTLVSAIPYWTWKLVTQANELDPLKEQKAALIQQIEARNGLVASLHTIATDLNTLFDYVLSAEKVVTQLEGIWQGILTYIDSSKQTINTATQYTVLRMFVIKLEAVMGNWSNVKKNSSFLVVALS
ncbi:alpha-xenorhabdolysin family binary toxin subunit A [Pseudomonas sp. SED1]|jgi:hypothetical protein|uniref:alpha-xenorhabdolysin family binary toxin subunit A n=1 Tax=Pseudomonas sp. SED1 TaxID=3056845 RepID=UPI00296EEFFD|nr:alpha-xenorhabdolysin family binary toxin subunit A [Pseudomonas sp. SED1]MDY0834985.1 alpha-xenorhabdolysin family binary toxin subunit A [Pseudomonas sp. SED1]